MATTNTPAIDATTDMTTMVLTLAFSNGETIALSVDELSRDIQHHAMLHGLKQKLVDAAAISRNPDTGRSATIGDKYQAVLDVYNRLLAGNWNKPRDGSSVSGGLLFRALCKHYPAKTPEAIRTFLEKKTPTEKAALRALPAIAEIIATLKAEPTSDIDTDALLAGLED